MNRPKLIVLVVALALIGGTGGMLARIRANQQLGKPGIKTSPIPGSQRLDIYLPELVLNYTSAPVPLDTNLFLYMPQDSSFAQRIYQQQTAEDGPIVLNAVLMGTDRTTIHKPEFCLTGAGWNIDDSKTLITTVHMQRPEPYDLPVKRLLASREVNYQGKPMTIRRVYVYWFVADNQLTADHRTRMWSMAKELLRTGVLERWAYLTCCSDCLPGQEEATYARIEKFIQWSVPQFQLVPGSRSAGTAATQMASQLLR
jgi:Protein of unknown function (DUF3485)